MDLPMAGGGGDGRGVLGGERVWVEPDSSAAFALEANADWIAATVTRP